MKIVTKFVYPPIPIRDHDWCAYDDNLLDEGCTVGNGRTEYAAVCELTENALDRGEMNRLQAVWYRVKYWAKEQFKRVRREFAPCQSLSTATRK